MKNYLIVLFLLVSGISFSQEEETFYQTTNGEYAFKLKGETCILYQFSRYENSVYREWELDRVDRFKGELDSLGTLFSDGEYAVSYDYKYFRILKLKRGKPKDRRTFVAKKTDDPSCIYAAINHAYWDKLYEETLVETANTYMFFEYDYYHREGDLWESIPFKYVESKTFEKLANERNQQLKDSLALTNQQLISLNDSIEKNMTTLTLEELKSNFLGRPLRQFSYSTYQNEMLESVAEKRPDLFLDLAEALPAEKEYIFDLVLFGSTAKSLKKFETDSPVKKEFLKYRRRERTKVGLIMTGIVSLQAAVIGGAITGIVFWIRK